MFKAHKKLGENTWFAAGAWTWMGYASGNKKTMDTSLPGMRSAAEHGIENVFVTIWGDNGRECSYFSALPSLYAAKRFYDGVTDMDVIKAEFKKIIGEDFDGMCALDLPNFIGGNDQCTQNACKIMLYSDPFNGFLDSTIPNSKSICGEYQEIAAKLRAYGKESAYAYIFEMEALLCDLLSVKYELGARTRAAYQGRDKAALKALVKDYKQAEKRLWAFYHGLEKLWYIENKPQGFEVLELRLGGLALRLQSCRKRLALYVKGKGELPELDEVLLDFYGNGKDFKREIPCLIDWIYNASANTI
jgi:hypothetical protein